MKRRMKRWTANATHVRICRRCGTQVEPSNNPRYKWQCLNCDEDLYNFETELIKRGIDQ
jgi:hypothetical protein